MGARPPPEVPGHKQQSVAVIQQYLPRVDHRKNFGNVEKGSVEWVESYSCGHKVAFIGPWSSGNSADFDSAVPGSNPGGPAI